MVIKTKARTKQYTHISKWKGVAYRIVSRWLYGVPVIKSDHDRSSRNGQTDMQTYNQLHLSCPVQVAHVLTNVQSRHRAKFFRIKCRIILPLCFKILCSTTLQMSVADYVKQTKSRGCFSIPVRTGFLSHFVVFTPFAMYNPQLWLQWVECHFTHWIFICMFLTLSLISCLIF